MPITEHPAARPSAPRPGARIGAWTSLLVGVIAMGVVFAVQTPPQTIAAMAIIVLAGIVAAVLGVVAQRIGLTVAGFVMAVFGVPLVIAVGYLIGGV